LPKEKGICCPHCGASEDRQAIIDTRPGKNLRMRVHLCGECKKRFKTEEKAIIYLVNK
jgi:transcriptional regulator NrdR family protein